MLSMLAKLAFSFVYLLMAAIYVFVCLVIGLKGSPKIFWIMAFVGLLLGRYFEVQRHASFFVLGLLPVRNRKDDAALLIQAGVARAKTQLLVDEAYPPDTGRIYVEFSDPGFKWEPRLRIKAPALTEEAFASLAPIYEREILRALREGTKTTPGLSKAEIAKLHGLTFTRLLVAEDPVITRHDLIAEAARRQAHASDGQTRRHSRKVPRAGLENIS